MYIEMDIAWGRQSNHYNVSAHYTSLVLAPYEANIFYIDNILASCDALVLTENAAAISFEYKISASCDVLTLAENAATVDTDLGTLELTSQSGGYYSLLIYDGPYYDVGQDNVLPVTSVNKSDGDVVNITVNLSAAKAIDTNVSVVISGGHSQYEDYGIGKHYHLTCAGATITNTSYNETTVALTIPAGATTKTISMSIVNNPVLGIDRVLTISAVGYGATKTLTIVDDNRADTIDVTNTADMAAHGASPLDKTGAVEATTDWGTLITSLGANPNVVLYFPNGEYRFKDSQIPPGSTLWGESYGGVTIKRAAGYFTDRIGIWERVFVGTAYNSATDSNPIGLINILFDGDDLPQILRFQLSANAADGHAFTIDTESNAGGPFVFTFRNSPVGSYEVQIGASKEASITNATAAVNALSATINVRAKADGAYLGITGTISSPWAQFIRGSVSGANWVATVYTNEQNGLNYWSANAAGDGRLVVRQELCGFANQIPADGLAIANNVDYDGYYLNATNCPQRGGYTVGGGNSRIKLKNISTDTAPLHTEADVFGKSVGGKSIYYWELIIDGLDSTCGDNVRLNSRIGSNSVLTANDIQMGPGGYLTLSGGGADAADSYGSLTITNSTLYHHHSYLSGMGECLSPGKILIQNSTLICSTPVAGVTRVSCYPRINFHADASYDEYQEVVFDNVIFDADSTVSLLPVIVAGIYGDVSNGSNNKIIFRNNCVFTERVTCLADLSGLIAASSYKGGYVEFEACTPGHVVNCDTTGVRQALNQRLFWLRSDTGKNWTVKLSSMILSEKCTRLFYSYVNSSSNSLLVQDMTLPKAANANAFDGLYAATTLGRPDGNAGVMRTITGGNPEAADFGLFLASPACYDESPLKKTTLLNKWEDKP